MVLLFPHLHHVTQNSTNLNNNHQIFLDFTKKYLFNDDSDDNHLPIPVYSGIKNSMGTEFIWNTLLSLGIFSTKREIFWNDTLSGCFRNAKLIRKNYDPKSLQNYSNQVMNIFFNNQLVFLQIVNVWLTI